MSMISELVDRLRAEAESMGKYGVDYMATLLTKSADTIVMLSEKARSTEAKHGEWIWISSTYDRTPCRKTYMCSCCRHEVITFDVEPWEHYCPQCGAKMDGERESE